MSTVCACGHARSQHHVQQEGGPRVCDYAGYSCNCEGYKVMNAKCKPKSCSCVNCKRGKHRGVTRRAENKAWRSATKAALRAGAEDVSPVLTGTYTD